jgi:trimethylamine--corrinoid protein Co-methyltransferase
MQLSRLAVLSESEVAAIHEASLQVLSKKGVRILSRRALEFLSDFDGVEVDITGHTAKFEPSLVEKKIAQAPPRFQLFDRSGLDVITIGGPNCHCLNGHCAIYQHDAVSGARHPVTMPEIEQYARLADRLDAIGIIGIQGTPHEVDPEMAFVAGAYATLRNSDKPFQFTPEFSRENRDIQEMVRVLGGGEALRLRPSILVQHTTISPLCWPAEIVESLVENARDHIPVVILSAPYSGVTAPYTLAGQLTLINAEVLSGIVIAQLASPGCPVVWGSSCASFDMSHLSVLIGSPEASLMRIAGAQLAHYYHLPSFTTAPDTDSHLPDQQSAWEKFESTFCAFAAGVNVICNAGMFSTGVCVSRGQLVMDAETYSACMRLLRGIEVSEETISLKSVLDITESESFMLAESTIAHLRSGEHSRPLIANRLGYEKWQGLGGMSTERAAAAKALEILERHPPREIPQDKEDALKGILNRGSSQ